MGRTPIPLAGRLGRHPHRSQEPAAVMTGKTTHLATKAQYPQPDVAKKMATPTLASVATTSQAAILLNSILRLSKAWCWLDRPPKKIVKAITRTIGFSRGSL